jgi:hypothetical protein
MEVQPDEAFCGTCGFNMQQAAGAPPAAAAPPAPAQAAPPQAQAPAPPPPPQPLQAAAPPAPAQAPARQQPPAAPATPADAAQNKAAKGKKANKEPKEPKEKKPGGGFLKMDLKTLFSKGKKQEETGMPKTPGKAAAAKPDKKAAKEKKSKPAAKRPGPAADEGKKKILLAVLGVVAVGAIAFFGYNTFFGQTQKPATMPKRTTARNTGTQPPNMGKNGATAALVTEEDLANMKAQRRGRFEDVIDLAAADFSFAGFAAPDAAGTAGGELNIAADTSDAGQPTDTLEIEKVEPGTLTVDMAGADGSYQSMNQPGTYDKPAEAPRDSAYAYPTVDTSSEPARSTTPSYNKPAPAAQDHNNQVYAYIPPSPRKTTGGASPKTGSQATASSELRAYGAGAGSMDSSSADLYGWKNKGTVDSKNLLAVRDEFNGPGKPSGPGGSFGQFTTFHKVLVAETTNYAEMETARDELTKRNLSPEVHRYDIAGDTYYEITVGHYTTKDLAENVANEIRGKGYTPRIVTEKVYH